MVQRDCEVVQHRTAFDADLYRRWRDTLDGDTPAYERFERLMELDCEYNLDELVDREWYPTPRDIEQALSDADPDENAVGVLALQIKRRCMTAVPDARYHHADVAADELIEIQQRADRLLDGD